MSAPLVPSPLDYIGRRKFAFYPAIRNVEWNEWRLGFGSWSEVEVLNARTGQRIWLPRTCIGAVSETGDRTPIVGLVKELEYRAGSLSPRARGVVEMPHAAHELLFPVKVQRNRESGPAPVIAIRLEASGDSSFNRLFATLGVGALVVCLLAGLASGLARIP